MQNVVIEGQETPLRLTFAKDKPADRPPPTSTLASDALQVLISVIKPSIHASARLFPPMRPNLHESCLRVSECSARTSYLFWDLSVCVSLCICLCAGLPACLSVYLFAFLLACLPVRLSVYMSVRVSVCLHHVQWDAPHAK